MNATPCKASLLADRMDRACAKLARKAMFNTINGGASAMVLADRMESMGSRVPAGAIVSAVYARSSGRTDPEWGAWQCGECGCAHLGQDAANECCSEGLMDVDEYGAEC